MISFVFLNFSTFNAISHSKNCRLNTIKMSAIVERFSNYLIGDWTNYKQATEFPALWSHIHVCYQPLPINFLGTQSFYVESSYNYSLDKPYKTAVVSIKESEKGIEMQNYKIMQPERFWFGAHEPSLLTDLQQIDLFQLPNICDTIFEYNEEKEIYFGKTRPGKKCLIIRGEKKTYLDSRMVISRNEYSSWDIGREIESDEQIWGATSGPFCFERVAEKIFLTN
jgi:hypothetical protein|mmetsp:Transcript_2936/g.4177  ORF Transcript_2936/g.4177 Transcript_2936/m.4177 type:complete len:224 (-) Transcript_2936:465-1136(-)